MVLLVGTMVLTAPLTAQVTMTLDADVADEVVRGFVSVEPFEVRLEALIEIDAFRVDWEIRDQDLGKEAQKQILAKVEALLIDKVAVTSGGDPLLFTGSEVRFVKFDPERGYLVDERETIPLGDALAGVTLVSTKRGVTELELEWNWFARGQERAVIEVTSAGRPAARYVTPENGRMSWRLDGELEAPALIEVPEAIWAKGGGMSAFHIISLILLAGSAVIVFWKQEKAPRWIGLVAAVGLALGFLGFKLKEPRVLVPEGEEIEELLYSLLRNTYHAFDFRDDSEIYDTLAESVTGSLLERTFLEVRQSLELESSGGPRVRVYEVSLRETELLSRHWRVRDSFQVRASWVTIGEVTHWGHEHERTNRYEAEFNLLADEEHWRIQGLDLLNEERVLQRVSRTVADPEG
ncbi:MAG: hypothetical protein AAF236_11915 [Verrucomicrobiota bacterium]